MERDFMGMNGKESGNSSREDGRPGRQDSGSPSVQWPFSNKMSALQQFMTYKVGQEERAKKLVFDQFSSSGSQTMTTNDAFEASRKASPVQAQQKCFALDRQGSFPMNAYSIPNEARSSHMANNSIPVATSNPFFTVHSSPSTTNAMVSSLKQQSMGGGITSSTPLAGSAVGPFPPRSLSKLPTTTAQLTIFYGGSVCVYDDVPSDKAHAIMFLANRGSNTSSNASNSRPQAPVPSHAKATGGDGLSMNKTPMQAAIQNMNQTPMQAAVQNMNQTPMQTASHNMNQNPSHNMNQNPSHNMNQNPIRMHIQKAIQSQSQNQNQSHTVLQNQPRTVINVVSSSSGLSSTVSATSHSVSQTGSGSSATNDLAGAKSIGPSSTNYQNEPPKTATVASGTSVPASSMPRAIPQARKASLARFLEKRKERVISAAPYPSNKSSPNDIEGTDGLTNSSSVAVGLSSNHEEGWIRGSQNTHQPLSTKLHM